MMWKRYYMKRVMVNGKKLPKASFSEAPGIHKLIQMDKKKIKLYQRVAMEQWNI